jgi:hypothetical protein
MFLLSIAAHQISQKLKYFNKVILLSVLILAIQKSLSWVITVWVPYPFRAK